MPGAQQTVLNPVVGVTQETSPTSVEPMLMPPVLSFTSETEDRGCGSMSDFCISFANAISSGEKLNSANARKLRTVTRVSVSFGNILCIPPRYSTSSLVSVASAPNTFAAGISVPIDAATLWAAGHSR